VSPRVAAVAMVLAVLPPSCGKLAGKKPPPPEPDPPTPTPVVVTSATTPPIWHPPEPPVTSDAATAATPPANPELAKAKAAAEAKDFKKVKALLDKRVRGGKGTTEEAQLLLQACAQLKDRACVEAVKKSHPDLTENSSFDRP
jgi:hypothetical protein